MKITVINGTEKHGVTYRLKEMFMEQFSGAEITEYYLPKDCPAFCAGCTTCFLKGEENCKDSQYVQAIEKSLLAADLIVMTSPAYVFHATGAMKAFLDHLGYRWMPHRPAAEMFGKRAVIISQCLGSGASNAAKDIKHSLSWWGISDIGTFSGSLMSDVIWDNLPEKKRKSLEKKVKRLAKKYSCKNYSKHARVNIAVRLKFTMCRMIQISVHKNGSSADSRYWEKNGWLGKARPWNHTDMTNISLKI